MCISWAGHPVPVLLYFSPKFHYLVFCTLLDLPTCILFFIVCEILHMYSYGALFYLVQFRLVLFLLIEFRLASAEATLPHVEFRDSLGNLIFY